MRFRPSEFAALALAQHGISQSTADHLLQVLYVIAAVLAFVLIAVIALAVNAWRKNKDSDPGT